MNQNRPRFLNLWQIRLPLTGIVSILHRVSGVFLFLSFPFLLYLLQLSLRNAEGFAQAQTIINSGPITVVGLLLLWLFAHHLFAGLRVMHIDLDWGSDLLMARRTALIVLVAALLVLIVGALL